MMKNLSVRQTENKTIEVYNRQKTRQTQVGESSEYKYP